MSQNQHPNLALFIDFDNVALGARDARQRFDIKLLLQRVLEKGKIIVKRAYADWHYYKEHMAPLHEAAIELIEIPMPRISGKNSADIRLVVDAMDLCYSKDHIDTFVIVSGDSDFSPLVSKLRENNKRVIGIGVKNSSSNLLINNCDEFIFYDDIYRQAVGQLSKSVGNVPADKRELFDFLVQTAQGLLQESRGVLYSSLIKDTMTRKQPDFNERAYGYGNFGELLEDARQLGLLKVERDARAGGTWVVQGLGDGLGGVGEAGEGNGKGRSRRRRRSGSRGRDGEAAKAETDAKAADEAQVETAADPAPAEAPAADAAAGAPAEAAKPVRKKRSRRKPAGRAAEAKAEDKAAAKPADKAADKAAEPKAADKASAPADPAPAAEPAAGKTTKKTAKKTTRKTVKKTTKKVAKKTAKKAEPTGSAPAAAAAPKAAKAPAKKTAKKAAKKTAKKTTKKAAARKTTKKTTS
jgi:uncharacterized protein (TIGR00288 family)